MIVSHPTTLEKGILSDCSLAVKEKGDPHFYFNCQKSFDYPTNGR
jgi:hypothetical protein